jgi:hypothetical protein
MIILCRRSGSLNLEWLDVQSWRFGLVRGEPSTPVTLGSYLDLPLSTTS